MKTQRGFTLLIGLILLLGITTIGLSLANRGLLETRMAYSTEQASKNFQQTDGIIAKLLNKGHNAFLELDKRTPCKSFSIMTGSEAGEISVIPGEPMAGCPAENVIVYQRQELFCSNEYLARVLASSSGKSLCRYFELIVSNKPNNDMLSTEHNINQGVANVSLSAASAYGLNVQK